jgi:hypothetical protein
VLHREVRMSRERGKRGATDKQENVPRPRFGNRKYDFLHQLIAPEGATD